MRKTAVIAALLSFLVCLLAGYYAALWRGEQHPAETEAHAVLEEKKRIHAGTKIVYQYFYTQDRVMKKHIEPAPEFLQGLDLEQLKSIYTGWQVVFFSSEQVILRCSIEGMSDEVYVLGEDEGFLAVFYEDGKKQLRLKARTALPLSALPDGEARQLAGDVAVSAALQGRETVEREILQDAYAPTGTVTLEKETVTYPVTVGSGKNQFSLKERIHLEESEKPLLRAEEIWGEVRLSEARTATDAVEADGVLTVSLLYHCENDETPLCMLERGIPFGQMMELRGVAEGDAAAVQLRLDDLDFQMLSEQEGELRAAVTMEAVVLRDETAEIVKDITPEEEAAPSPMAGAVIYMVQPGDTLWKIAKRYRTTVEDILAINEIENPDLIYPGQKLLIIKQIH